MALVISVLPAWRSDFSMQTSKVGLADIPTNTGASQVRVSLIMKPLFAKGTLQLLVAFELRGGRWNEVIFQLAENIFL